MNSKASLCLISCLALLTLLSAPTAAQVPDSTDVPTAPLVGQIPSNLLEDFERAAKFSRPNVLGRFILFLQRESGPLHRELDQLFRYIRGLEDDAASAQYSTYDSFLSASGLIADVWAVDVRAEDPVLAARYSSAAQNFYRTYLRRNRNRWAFEPRELKSWSATIRVELLRLQEQVWQRWEDETHRVPFHVCGINEACHEYFNVLANWMWLSDGSTDVLTEREGASPAPLRVTNENVVHDYGLLLSRLRQNDLEFEDLVATNRLWRIDRSLLSRLTQDRSRWPSSLSLFVFFLSIGCGLALIRVLLPPHSGINAVDIRPGFSLHERDLFGWFSVKLCQGSTWRVAVASFWWCGVVPVLLAFSEETLLTESPVVDRAFMDYWSFTASAVFLIPACLAIGTLFYVRSPSVAQVVIDTVSGDDLETRSAVEILWNELRERIQSPTVIAGVIALSLVIVVGQKVQWLTDPGTAFVDLSALGQPSLTAWYMTFEVFIVYYAFITLLYRYIRFLGFIGKVFWQSQHRTSTKIRLQLGHPDGKSGLRCVGRVVLSFGLVVMGLFAQINLNLLEKSSFYGSLDTSIAFTQVSVIIFGLAYLIFVPIPGLFPLYAIHKALRRNVENSLSELAGRERAYLESEDVEGLKTLHEIRKI